MIRYHLDNEFWIARIPPGAMDGLLSLFWRTLGLAQRPVQTSLWVNLLTECRYFGSSNHGNGPSKAWPVGTSPSE